MKLDAKPYVHETEFGGLRVTGSRVSLDSVVYVYLEGRDVEEIVYQFPVLTLEQVHGAIAFFLANQTEVEEYLRRQGDLWDELRAKCEVENRDLRERLRASMKQREAAGRSA